MVNKLFMYYSLQAIWIGYVVGVRPFEGVKENVIEIVNEFFLSAVSIGLIPMQYRDTRGDEATMVMVFLVLSNGIIITLIVALAIIKDIFIKVAK